MREFFPFIFAAAFLLGLFGLRVLYTSAHTPNKPEIKVLRIAVSASCLIWAWLLFDILARLGF